MRCSWAAGTFSQDPDGHNMLQHVATTNRNLHSIVPHLDLSIIREHCRHLRFAVRKIAIIGDATGKTSSRSWKTSVADRESVGWVLHWRCGKISFEKPDETDRVCFGILPQTDVLVCLWEDGSNQYFVFWYLCIQGNPIPFGSYSLLPARTYITHLVPKFLLSMETKNNHSCQLSPKQESQNGTLIPPSIHVHPFTYQQPTNTLIK